MNNRAQRKIMQSRNILLLVILACAAKLVKLFIDGKAEIGQVVAMIIVIVILAVVFVFYSYIDRYTKAEQKNYGESGDEPESAKPMDSSLNQPKGLKAILKEIFKHSHSGK